MEAREFIKIELSLFVNKFKNSKLQYQYDSDSLVHFVEIVKCDKYNSEEYLQWEDDVYDRFVSAFPNANICFVSEKDPVRVTFPEEIFIGDEYTEEAHSRYSNFYIMDHNMMDCEEVTTNKTKPIFNIRFA